MIEVPTITGQQAIDFIHKADNPSEVEISQQQIDIYNQMNCGKATQNIPLCNSLEGLVATTEEKLQLIAALIEARSIVEFFPVEIKALGTVFVVDSNDEITSLIKNLCQVKQTDDVLDPKRTNLNQPKWQGQIVIDRNREDVVCAIETGHRASELLSEALGELEKCNQEIANKDAVIARLGVYCPRCSAEQDYMPNPYYPRGLVVIK